MFYCTLLLFRVDLSPLLSHTLLGIRSDSSNKALHKDKQLVLFSLFSMLLESVSLHFMPWGGISPVQFLGAHLSLKKLQPGMFPPVLESCLSRQEGEGNWWLEPSNGSQDEGWRLSSNYLAFGGAGQPYHLLQCCLTLSYFSTPGNQWIKGLCYLHIREVSSKCD